ncbi:gamma-glutamyl hydrolase 2-like [Euphorbia lathyris]|uniref:gamma-glutamyl hydrolase 2-like n=1 Tax=Euphorbia lathyris TaxID=212925 RepID=UPI003313FA1B
MPSNFLSNSPSTTPSSSSDLPNDAVSLPSTSASSSSHQDMWSYLWIPVLISLSKELSLAKAAQSNILLPGQLHNDSSLSVPKCTAPDTKLNYRPVIGILTHPGDGASGRLNNATNTSYIAASYVKFVESAGARVIPLIYNEPAEILFEKLNLVNGVLFTGGWAKNGLYYDTVKAVFKQVLAKNDAGDHFPLYAICLGFELLTMIISEDTSILESFNAADQASTLQFMKNINIEGTVFQRFPPDLLRKMSTDCLVMQNHHYGISPKGLQENQDLSGFFKILTTSADSDNQVYVSTVQAYNYPVTAFQWHPEKNAFEWGLSMIPHSEDAIQVTQHVANFFVSEARKSLNRPPARKVLDNLIYNYSPTYCGKAGKGYDEVYIFSEQSKL